MRSYILVPLLLGLEANISDYRSFDPEYLFDLNKTTVVHREPLQTTYLNTTVICQPYDLKLLCLLQNVTFLTTLKYTNLNVTDEISKEHVKFEQWFLIDFKKSGVKDVRIRVSAHEKENELKLIKSIIKDVANQFNISSDAVTRLSSMHLKSDFSKLEDTPIGTCTVNYNMNMMYEGDEKQPFEYRIIPLSLTDIYTEQQGIRTQIEKKRQSCEYLATFADFLNGMEVSKYNSMMEISNDKLNIFTIMDVEIPSDSWNPSGSPVFTETILLSLTNIRKKTLNGPTTSFSII